MVWGAERLAVAVWELDNRFCGVCETGIHRDQQASVFQALTFRSTGFVVSGPSL